MDGIIEQIGRLTLAEKRDLAEQLRAAIAREMAAGRGDPDRCPRCGCPRFVRKGRDGSGRQRWLCSGCARTFGASSMGLLGCSKLRPEAWMEFAACMADELPLRETARRVGVSLYTAWYMRMRVCEVMGRRLAPYRGDSFEVDGTYFPESLPGNHSRSAWHDLGREAWRSGHDGRGRGLAGKACVICGAGESGDCFCQLVNGAESAADAGLVALKLPEGCSVATDARGCYSSAFGARPHEVRDSRSLGMANSLHSRLKAFIARFNGVSVRRLQRYLDWFCWREQFRRGAMDRRELLYGQEVTGTYSCTRALTHLEDWPFISAWNRYSIGPRYGHVMTLAF